MCSSNNISESFDSTVVSYSECYAHNKDEELYSARQIILNKFDIYNLLIANPRCWSIDFE